MAKIMVVAGGKWQCPIVKQAKAMGHYVICTDPHPDAPAFKYADKGLVADVLDKEKNLMYACEFRPDVVLTEQSDIAVMTVSYIAKNIGIMGISEDIASRFTNKYEMRRITEKAGFISPSFQLCRTVEEAKAFVKNTGKSIMKPLDSQSSRGCHILQSPAELESYFCDSISYSNCDRAVIIEEYIDGREFTVDGLMTDAGYIVTAISQKEHFSYNDNIAKRLIFSWKNDSFDYCTLADLNRNIVSAMGLPFGITHAEYKYYKGNFYLIEIAARGGGTRISSDIVPLMSAVNSEKEYIKVLLGKYVHPISKHCDICAMLGFFDIPQGLVTEINGIDKAKTYEGVVDVELEVNVGDYVRPAEDDRSRCGYYIIYADTMKKLRALESKILNTVIVTQDD